MPLRTCVRESIVVSLKKKKHNYDNDNTGTVLNEKVSSYVIFETDFLSNMIYFIKCYDFLDAQRRKYGDHVLLPDGESSDEAFFLIHDVMSVVRKLAKGVREKMRNATNSKRIEHARQVRCGVPRSFVVVRVISKYLSTSQISPLYYNRYFVSSLERNFILVPFERSTMMMMMMMIRRIGECSRIRFV